MVVVLAVAVVFAIGLVVLLVVADEVVQREAVVARDEVDAGVRPAAAVLVEIAAAGDARRELGDEAAIAIARSAGCESRYRPFHSAQPTGKLPT